MRARRSRRNRHEQTELNITAFLNLMVILVPFLLITAVFSRITILNLQIPTQTDTPPPKEQPQQERAQVQVIVRGDVLQVSDGKRLLKQIPLTEDDADTRALADYLQLMKTKVPDKRDASILVEPDVAYDTLVAVMDAVRLVEISENNVRVQAELFPDISIGDAPPRKP